MIELEGQVSNVELLGPYTYRFRLNDHSVSFSHAPSLNLEDGDLVKLCGAHKGGLIVSYACKNMSKGWVSNLPKQLPPLYVLLIFLVISILMAQAFIGFYVFVAILAVWTWRAFRLDTTYRRALVHVSS